MDSDDLYIWNLYAAKTSYFYPQVQVTASWRRRIFEEIVKITETIFVRRFIMHNCIRTMFSTKILTDQLRLFNMLLQYTWHVNKWIILNKWWFSFHELISHLVKLTPRYYFVINSYSSWCPSGLCHAGCFCIMYLANKPDTETDLWKLRRCILQ